MAKEELDDQYELILEQERREGRVVEEYTGPERRKNPRIKVVPGDLPVEIDPWVFAIDVSISGMAFYSDKEEEAGKIVDIDLAGLPPVKARVVDSHLEQSDNPYQPSRHRLHCEFEDPEKGKELLVRIKEMEGNLPGATPS